MMVTTIMIAFRAVLKTCVYMICRIWLLISWFLDGFELLGVGFGYNSRNNDYKVVVVKSLTREQSPYRAEFFRKIPLPEDIEDPANYSNENPAVLTMITVRNESVALLFYCEEVPVVIHMPMMEDSGGDENGSCCWGRRMNIGPIEVAFWNDDNSYCSYLCEKFGFCAFRRGQ
ncbi:hypothetical protein PanWU01x14_331970 [Parasponia andersonii]|uniref:Uncharacterized protein n=1 Tax=Parasponia andersonii TaxID=3476 RepID=A0A2P5AHI8_PARAD|nr:hypothetical protein PanWU01x14_331970 [Parasponia andersonii]